MLRVNITFTILFTFFTGIIFAQTPGLLTGTVYEKATGESVPFAEITIIELDQKAKTDFDGIFKFQLYPGTYSIKIESFQLESQVIYDVVVKGNETTKIEDVYLEQVVNEFDQEVIITAERTKNTEAAVVSMKMKTTNLIDGISADGFKRIGDSDGASAMKRVPGVSVIGGKYVYVRGLGDRYNKTLLNGLDVPGLDPDRNTIQMDIFPTSIIDNIIVNKTFIPELPADFTGGIVDIGLKEMPSEQIRNLSISSSFNPLFHLNDEYLKYKGGSTDFLGFDDGTRAIPAVSNVPFFAEVVGDANGVKGKRYTDILNKFNPNMAALQGTSGLDYSLSSVFGNQFKKEKFTYGYNAVLSYSNKTQFYQNVEYGRYGLSGNADITSMDVRELQTGEYGVNNVLLTGLLGFSVKTLNSKYSINALHIQNGESKAGIFDYYNADQGAIFYGFQHNLEYSQKSITNINAHGKHLIHNSNWDIDWKLATTLSLIKDPDIRFTRYEIRDDKFIISTEAGFPERIWRDLSERNISGKTDIKRTYKAFDRDASLKFGSSYTYKERDFDIMKYALNIRGLDLNGNPDELFTPINLWPANGNLNHGTTYEASFVPNNPNQFNSSIQNIGSYVSTEFSPSVKLKSNIGARVEYYRHKYTGQDQLGVNVLNNATVLETFNIFPSLNLIYSLNEMQNFRFSYGNTVARPSFKELSYAEIVDPLTGRTFIGGLFKDENPSTGISYWDGNLTSTTIHNFDLRWEFSPLPARIISLSAYYKKFIRPIEIIQFATQAGAFQPRNVGNGEVVGGEIELKQNLDFISDKLYPLSFVFNYTYTFSKIEFSKTEYESRIANARTGQKIKTYRDMAGQSPYLINAGFSYRGIDKGFWRKFEANLFYNVQGQTLLYVGMVDRPDIYTKEFHSLNLNVSKTFGKDDRMQLNFKVTNILNDKKEAVFISYDTEDQYFSRLTVGQNYSLKFSYNF